LGVPLKFEIRTQVFVSPNIRTQVLFSGFFLPFTHF
jgi:hypothetical protein